MHDDNKKEITDSISCLHAIEHFGLGRYGDKLDPNGYIAGFNNILKMLKPKGIMYISFPISRNNQTHFNAHRIFSPKDIFEWPYIKNQVTLMRFDYVDDLGNLHKDADIEQIMDVNFGCGIFTLIKNF
jgi:hypothetical protein